MRLSGNCVLITGGGSGIGLALARRFHAAGSELILCGRRAEALAAAARELPGTRTRTCDLAEPEARWELAAWLAREAPQLNVVVNNAGVQRRVALAAPEAAADWAATHEEIAINLEAPVDLSLRLLEQLRGKPGAAIVNITSGLAFVPLAAVPVYSATKAALRSFTLSLRRQLEGTGVEVIEVAPPALNTDLGGPGLHTFGGKVEEFADEVARRMEAGENEIAVGYAAQALQAGAEERRQLFERMNRRD